MELAAQTTFAERAGRTQGRMWWGFVRLERKAHGCLVVQGWALGVAKAALLVIKLVVLGVLFYAAFWLALCFCSWSLRPGLCARPIGMMNRNQNGAPVQMDSGCSMADTRSTSAFSGQGAPPLFLKPLRSLGRFRTQHGAITAHPVTFACFAQRTRAQRPRKDC
ncbi:MAG: DUF3742 family protein [Gammaproteobacteria bacterium]|nr:DUF3742 family protein [Gammaproteobacteria bacterium]